MDNQIKDSHLKSVLKGITWRLLATFTTIMIAYMITGQIESSLKIGGVEFLAKFVLYYFHERAWLLVPSRLTRIFARK